MFFLSYVCYAFACVCLYVPCGHLLGKGWPLGSRLWCLTVSLLLSHWYPGSGVVLDCIDSRSLHPCLLLSWKHTLCTLGSSLIWVHIIWNIGHLGTQQNRGAMTKCVTGGQRVKTFYSPPSFGSCKAECWVNGCPENIQTNLSSTIKPFFDLYISIGIVSSKIFNKQDTFDF